MLYPTMHLSIKFCVLYSLLVLLFNPMQSLLSSSPKYKLFEFHSLPYGNLTFFGDSHLQYGANRDAISIALTKEGIPTDAPRSTGMVLYSRPILFLDSNLKKVPSFSTMFAFSIRNPDGDEDSGDGLAFLISSDDVFLGIPGYLGLVDSTDLTRNKFIAIEFDTRCDPMFQDPDDNHVGLDINSLPSVKYAASSSLGGVNLKSGDLIRAWIDYQSDGKRLEVFLSYSNLKPVKPILKVDIDLSNYLRENMFVGFSAATKGSMQLTCIEEWEFTMVGFSPSLPPPSPSPELGRTLEFGHRNSHLSRLAIGLAVGVCVVSFMVAFGWFFGKKLMGWAQKLAGTQNLETQTIRSLGGTSKIRLFVPDINPDEVAGGLIIEKVSDNKTELYSCENSKNLVFPSL